MLIPFQFIVSVIFQRNQAEFEVVAVQAEPLKIVPFAARYPLPKDFPKVGREPRILTLAVTEYNGQTITLNAGFLTGTKPIEYNLSVEILKDNRFTGWLSACIYGLGSQLGYGLIEPVSFEAGQ